MELINLASNGRLQIATVVSRRHDLTTADGRAVALTVAAWDAAESDRVSERQTITFALKALRASLSSNASEPLVGRPTASRFERTKHA